MEEPRSVPIPLCCGSRMVLLRSGRRACFAIWLWRCPVCEGFEWTNRRYDGETFWVGAMGRAIRAEQDELIADAYSGGAQPGWGPTTR